MRICYIVGAVRDGCQIYKRSGDFVIAADKGYENLKGVEADLVVGDFDSLGYVPSHANRLIFPEKKDETDIFLAVQEGLKRGYRVFHISGALGGRLDHTVANLQVLAYLARQNAWGVLVGDGQCAAVFQNQKAAFSKNAKGLVSVFAFGGDAEGVTVKGLGYPLENSLLTPDFPLGVSNFFVGKASEIEVRKGALLVIWEGEPDLLSPW